MGNRLLVPLLVLSVLALVGIVFATGVTPNVTTVKTNGINQTVNFTFSNTNTTNITQVNFTLSAGFVFESGSNSTNATNWIFTNSTTTANWTNSSSIGIIANQSSAWFAFKVDVPFMFNSVNFTITTVDTNNSVNSTNVTITVEPDAVSVNRKFGALPSILYLNWTNGYISSNITLMGNFYSTENITLEILNSTAFAANYSQTNTQTACGSVNFTLLVQNSTGLGTVIGTINGSSSNTNNTNTTYVFINNFQCSPGRYRIEKLMIRNYTNSTENLNISVFLDVPISSNSTDYPLNLTTGIGSFYGTIQPNETIYHSYYFNATLANSTNFTSVTINITASSSLQDIDLFLFDNSGNLKAKSINKTATREWLTYNYLPSSNQMWEIRLYGKNFTSTIPYTGYIVFSTLNVTDASTNQEISSINFGNIMNVTNVSTANLQLKNGGNVNLTNVLESKELYYIQRFGNIGSQNITFLVPNSTIASKVKVSLNWTGASNYSFNVYKPDGSLALTSMNKFAYANVTNAMQEEYNETSDVGGTNGYWGIDVRNNTNVTNDAYNVTTYVYVNASKWITSNYTNSSSGFTINATGLQNSTYTIQVNLTVQNDTLDGKYEGYLQYQSSSGATIRIPIETTTKTGMLIVNNSMGGSTVQVDENIGINVTKVLNVTFNNTGNYSLSITTSDSSGILNLTTANKTIPFIYQAPSTVSTGGNGTINITLNLNTANTSDTQGVYDGYISFITNGSRPYQNFTLNLRVNLTSLLIVGFSSITPSITTTTNASAENVTLGLTLTYLNGSGLDNPLGMGAPNSSTASSNFSSAWLVSSNYSSYRIPTTGTLGIFNGTNPIYSAPNYNVKITVPANSPGGTYEARISANYTRSDNRTFTGYGISSGQGKYLIVNNSGLFMSTNYSSFSLSPSNTSIFYVNMTNYGPVTSNSTLNSISFTESCSDYSVSGVATNKQGNCTISGTNPYNLSVDANATCLVWWTITAASSGSGSACTGIVNGTGYWFNSLSASVTVTNATTTTTTTSTSGTTGTTTATTYNLEFSKAESLIPVQQSSSNSTEVGVKNTGTYSQNVTFRLEGINSTWYTVNATSAVIPSGGSAGFKITFIVGKEAVKDYSGKFNATSPTKAITKDFTLRILPAPEEKVKINDTLALYKADMINLETEINQSREKNMNVTLAEGKLKELKSKVEQAENYIKQGDYFNANQLLPAIKSLIDDTRNELSKAKEIVAGEKRRLVWIFVGIGIGLAVIGVLAYLFWPTKGYHAEKKVYFSEKEGLWTRIKNKLTFRKKVTV